MALKSHVHIVIMGDPHHHPEPPHTTCFFPLWYTPPPNCVTTEELEELYDSNTEFEGFWKSDYVKNKSLLIILNLGVVLYKR